MLGPMYWKNPKLDKVNRLAAAVKHNKGAVVYMPAITKVALSVLLFNATLAVGLSTINNQ